MPEQPSTAVVEIMSADEARAAVERIKSGFTDLRALLLDLHEREGWRSLGYTSWRECVVREFAGGQARLYQQLNAAEIERRITAKPDEAGSFSTKVETPAIPIPERQLRPLSRLQPRQQASAWAEAVSTAPEGRLSSKHVEAVVERRLAGPIPKPTSGRSVPSGQSFLPGFEPIIELARQSLPADEWLQGFLRTATPERARQLDDSLEEALAWLTDVKAAWDEQRERASVG